MQGEVRAAGQTQLQPDDIIFECPQCGKSLAIDIRGAGYIVRCPECQTEIQVPGTGGTAPATTGPETEAAPRESFDPGSDSSEALRAEIQRLTRRHAQDVERHERISAELALIQAALDRLVGLMEEAQSGN